MEELEILKEQIISMCKAMETENRNRLVHGKRITVNLNDRTLEVVYYKSEIQQAPILFGIHGGGFIAGGCAIDDKMWDTLRDTLGVNVISIGYRNTPDYRYPCAVNDVYDCMKYFVLKSEEYGFDSNKVIVFGSSAGGNLAAAVCLLANERMEFNVGLQILNYPYLDLVTTPEGKGHPTEEILMYHVMADLYAGSQQRMEDTVSLVLTKKERLIGLPEAIIIVGEMDALKKEGLLYGHMLRSAGVNVTERVAKGMYHGFFEISFYYMEGSRFIPENLKALAENGSLIKEQHETILFIKKCVEKWRNRKNNV